MSAKALTDRLAALSPAQRALFEQALRQKEEKAAAPRPIPASAQRTVPKREQYSPVPLSIDQERLWFIQQLDPASPVYNIYNAIRFRGPLDIGVLTAAFQEVVRRQEVLRTSFPAIDGQPAQVIVPHVELVLPEIDLRGLPEELREAEAERAAEAVVRRPFALDRLPLFNFPLIRLEDEDLVQPSIFHHIIVDRLSAEIMTVEIKAVYNAFLHGQPSPLPELHIQFADFAVWQRRRLEDEAFMAELLGWWSRRLDGAPELLAMPLDRPRPPVQGPDGSRRRLTLSRAHSEGLRTLAQSESMTLFIAGLALLKVLLVRWTNQEKLIVGTPYDYRQGPDLEPLMGFFLNQLVLYSDLSGNPTFREALARVRETALGAYAHHDLPFAKLVEHLKPERDLSRIPYTQVVFLLLPLPAHATPGVGSPGRGEVDEIAMDGFWVDARRTQFDINFALWEEEDGRLSGFIEHSTDLFDVATIDRMRELFRNLLATVLTEPDRPIWDVPLLSEAQTQQLVREWNPREESGDAGDTECLHRLFEEQARRAPDAPAVTFEERTLTYAELDREADRLASRLLDAGVAPGSRVGLSAGRGVELVAGILGILKAGCAYVPLDPEYPRERLDYLVADAGVAVVVAGPDTTDLPSSLSALRMDPIGPPSEASSSVILSAAKDLGEERSDSVQGGEAAPAQILRCAQDDRRGAVPFSTPVDPDQPAYVIYTSGSTGKPKGVVVTHRNVARLLTSTRRWFGFGPSDVWTLFHSYAFDFSVWEVWGALAFGGRLVVVPFWVSRSPEVFHAVLARERVTVLNQTPSAFRQLLALENVASLPALRWVVFGGEALEPQSLMPWWDRYGDERPGLVNMYGITEITVHATFRRVRREDSEPGRGSRIGVPLPDLSIHVLDPAGRPAPLGVSGELCVGGEGVALGYLDRPALTAERFVPDAYGPQPGGRLYRSGDLARWLASGELEYQGRIDHQVKVRGFRIELGEIEAALGQHAALKEAVVIARNGGGATQLAAYVVPLDGTPPTVEELRSHLRERLPEYMVPAVFVTLDALPLTPTGKVDRKSLPDPGSLGRAELGTEYAAPQTPAEEALCRVWAEVLRVERVGRHDNFFSLGGDSILSLRVVALAGQQGLKLSLPDLFRFQTVAELASQAGDVAGEAASAMSAASPAHTEPFSLVSAEDRARLPEDAVDAYPLAALQAGMMYHMVLRPEDPPYHNVDSWHLRGPFELAPFQEAVDRVVRRHPILRTSFDLTGYGEPIQIVHREAHLPVVVEEDLSHLSDAEQEAAVDALIAREKRRLHDFTRPPQLRIHVQLRSAGTFQFTLTENHAIFDGWSLHATLAEIFELYLELLDGKDVPEPEPVPLAYRDFVALERQAIASPEATAYWERVLADRPTDPLPRWPSWPKPEVWPRIRGVVLHVPRPVFHGLKDLARAAAVPFKSVLLASHFAAQSRLTGNPDVITGVVANGRMEEAAGDQVRGLFLNTLPLRLRLPEGSWLDLARETARAEQEMLPFRRVPFATLQRRAGGDQPLFRMPFNYIHFHAVRDLLRTGRIEMVEFKRAEGSNFEITANYSQALEGVELGGEMEYDSQIWAREEVEAIVDLYSRVLEAMAADPAAPCLQQPLLSQAQRQQILHEWNDTESGHEPGLTHELFAAQAARTPGVPAVVLNDLSLTYAELRERAGRLARHLAALGVRPEARVAVCLERSPEWAVAMLAIFEAGGVYVPLDPAYPTARLGFMLADSGTTVLLTEESLRGRLLEAAGTDGKLDPSRILLLPLAPGEGSELPTVEPAPVRLTDAAYVIYTSGSTGTPKGVVVEHRSLALLLQTQIRLIGITPADRVSFFSAFSFDASLMDLFGTLLSGGTSVMFERRPALDLDRVVEGLGGLTVVHGVPALVRQVARAARQAGVFPGVRAVLTGGDAIPADLAREVREAFPRARIHFLYGPTETTIYCCHEEWDETAVPLPAAGPSGAPLGRPIADVEIVLLDPARQPVPAGVAGEMYVGGPLLARGYLDRPELTDERFPVIPALGGRRHYRTGDLARALPDGRLEFLGRVDLQVKIRGFRIEPGEIEAVLGEHPGVREAAVIARKEGDAQRLIACVVPRQAQQDDFSLTGLRAFLRDRLPDYMVPSAFLVLPALPLSPAGKVDRLALSRLEPEAGVGNERGSVAYQPPRTPVEEAVASLWADVLGVPRVGIRDDFFELGGDSLLATRVVSRMRSALGVELRLAALFERPTVAALAPLVQAAVEAGRTGAPPLAPRPERGGVSEGVPLSFAQQRLWFLDRMEPGATAYNMPLAVRLQGELDEAALEAALAAIVERHEALRTVFAETPAGPVQLALPPAGFFLPRVDLAALGAGAEEEAQRLADDDAVRPFDLQRGPLFRPVLLRLAVGEETGDAVLLGGMHHIVSDGWSTGVLLAELAALYTGQPLPPLPVQYADFAVWQRRWLSGEVLEAELDYWREHLRGLPPQLELPFDRPRPAVRRGRGATRPFALAPEVAAGLRALARSEGMTLFMVLLAGAEALLSRLANQEDFGIGTPIAGRNRLETEGLIGFFVNTLVLRSGTAGDPAFRALLGRAREETLAAYAHQDLPFEKLVEELAPERSLAHTPLFQVLFTVQGQQGRQGQAWTLPGLTLSRFGAEETHAKFDLTLALGEDPTGLAGLGGGVEYDRDLFDGATVERWLSHLGTMLGAAVLHPDRRLSELPLLTAAERHQILEAWNANAGPYPRERSLAGLFEEQVALRPEAPALVWTGSEWSYAALDAAAGHLAGHLRTLGVGPEVRVALCLPRTPAMVIATLAVVKAGGAYVPLDPEHPAERLAWMLEDAGAAIVVGEADWIAGPGAELPPASRLFVPVDGPAEAWDAAPAPGRLGGGALAYVMYTSGSTGTPKGVMVPQSAVVRLVRDTDYVPFTAGDRVALVSNPAFDAATFEVWGALLNGGCLVGVEKHDLLEPWRFAAALREHRVSAMFVTAALFHQTVREEPAAFATVRHLLVGGDAVDPRRARECLAAGAPERLLDAYGPTETTTFAAWHEVREVAAGAVVIPVGGPLRNARLHVLHGFEPVPLGVHGELCIGGDGLARGYLERPELTAERFVPDPFGASGERLYRTGDLARRRADGLIEVLGRRDRQVKIRGFRVEPGEVEAALSAHPSVREAAVVVRHEEGDKRLIAYLVGDADPLEVRRFLEGRLPEPMIPALLIFLPELPLTPTGKVDRLALAAREPEVGAVPAGVSVEPRDPVEETVAAIWAEVLRRERVGVYDDFFDLGGHSLLATQVLSRLRQTLGIEVDLRSLFESPTVAGLSEAVRRELRGDALPVAPPLVASEDEDPAPLSFAQQRLWFLDRLEPGSTAYNVPLAVRLRGELDVPALAASLGAIVARHDTLRTTFAVVDGQPVQVVAPPGPGPFELPLLDLSGEPDAAIEARRLAEEAGARPFDLARGPLFDPLLLRVAPDDHVLAVALHHIVSDGWSIGVFVRELGAFYRGDPPPEPLPVQYADFARWQRGWLSGEALEAELSYWRERLAGLPAQLELPFDRPRPAVRGGQAAYLPVELDAEETAALRRLAREEGATLFMTLLAGLEALLARWSGQEDFGLGTPIAGRNRVEIEGLIGFFVNTLVLRADLREDPGFRDLLGRVRRETLGAYTHQDLPFEKLVEELAPERDLSHTPLFQVLFALQNAPMGALELPGLALEPFPLAGESAKFDLTLSLMESGGGLAGSLEYDRGLFDEATAARLIQHLRTLWAGAAARPERHLSELPLLSEAEARQASLDGGAADLTGRPRFVQARFEEQAARRPGAVAVVGSGESWTYRELADRSAALAARLRALGVGPEVRVGVCARRTPALIAGLLGVLRAGGVYVPLDPVYPRERLAWILEDAQPACVLVGEGAAEALPEHGLPVLPLEAAAASAPAPSVADLHPDNLAYLIYTSGSTGRPKAVAVTHRTSAALIEWCGETFSREELAGVLASSSVSFDLSIFELYAPLSWGGRMILAPDALAVPTLAAASEVTVINTVPSAMAELVRSGGVPAGVRTVMLGGERLPRELAEAVLALPSRPRLYNMYGPSEDTTFSTIARVASGEGDVPLGSPLPGTRALVLDRWGALAPPGLPGDLHLAGAGLARGYLGRPDLTAERWVPDAFSGEPGARLYRTGDRVRLSERHPGDAGKPDLEYLGRLDQQVKVRGFRIEPGEVEAALLRHPAVREAAVVVAADPAGGNRLVAAVTPTETAEEASSPALRAFLRESLPEALVPSLFLFLEALPRTANGKIDRKAVARLAADPTAASAGDLGSQGEDRAPHAPDDPVRELLAGIWSAVLGIPVERIRPQDEFFDLSGHSLLAAQVSHRVHEVFGVTLPLRRLFERATLQDLAREIAHAMESGDGTAPELPPLEPLPRAGAEALLPTAYFQEWCWRLQEGPVGNQLNMALALRLRGPVDVHTLRRALTEIGRRHESLRTTLHEAGGAILQRVGPPAEVPVPVIDLQGLPPDLRERTVQEWVEEDAQRPFDLARGPLWTVRLLELGGERRAERVLLFNMHHAISDGWSIEVLQGEIGALYAAYAAGRPSPLSPLRLQFPDFGAWQRRLLSTGALQGQMDWWRRHLEGRPPVFALPSDRPAPAADGSRAVDEHLTLSAGLASRLREAARRESCTLPMLLFAGLSALMHRYSGQTDLVLGSVTAGRGRAELSPLIGMFMTHLPLRLDLAGSPSFRDLLARVRDEVLAAYAHQDVPLPRLLEDLFPGQKTHRLMLFRVLFNLLSFPVGNPAGVAAANEEDDAGDGLEIAVVNRNTGHASYDLVIEYFDSQERVNCRFKAAAGRISPEGLAALARDYEALLAQALADLDTPVGRLLPEPRYRPLPEVLE